MSHLQVINERKKLSFIKGLLFGLVSEMKFSERVAGIVVVVEAAEAAVLIVMAYVVAKGDMVEVW
jgi:hypothetical protein